MNSPRRYQKLTYTISDQWLIKELNEKIEELHRNNHVLAKHLMPWPVDMNSPEYLETLYREALRILKWSPERVTWMDDIRAKSSPSKAPERDFD